MPIYFSRRVGQGFTRPGKMFEERVVEGLKYVNKKKQGSFKIIVR